jgi:hypothetical protein
MFFSVLDICTSFSFVPSLINAITSLGDKVLVVEFTSYYDILFDTTYLPNLNSQPNNITKSHEHTLSWN